MSILKSSYSAREVASMTGLTARQLQWWDEHDLFSSHVSPKRTERGGYTERRYTPVDVLELTVLARLRRQGLTVDELRRILDILRDKFHVRLIDTIDEMGPVTLLSDGRDVYARTASGDLFNLLRDPVQPLLMIGAPDELKELSARVSRPKRRRGKKQTP